MDCEEMRCEMKIKAFLMSSASMEYSFMVGYSLYLVFLTGWYEWLGQGHVGGWMSVDG